MLLQILFPYGIGICISLRIFKDFISSGEIQAILR